VVNKKATLLPEQIVEGTEGRIYALRGQRLMLSHDLAALYQVETRVLMQEVQRNIERFPDEFAFKLTNQEVKIQRSQIVKLDSGMRTHVPHAITEQGIAMLSSVLRSKRAVGVSIEIVRSFVKLLSLFAGNKEMTRKLDALEEKYDAQFQVVFEAIRELMTLPSLSFEKRIGFIRE
jgi:hypothetical protein